MHEVVQDEKEPSLGRTRTRPRCVLKERSQQIFERVDMYPTVLYVQLPVCMSSRERCYIQIQSLG